MCAAANYAVCFGDQDPAQSLCFFPQRTPLFSGSNTVTLPIQYDASNTLGSEVSDR